jgi:hypothetical protein
MKLSSPLRPRAQRVAGRGQGGGCFSKPTGNWIRGEAPHPRALPAASRREGESAPAVRSSQARLAGTAISLLDAITEQLKSGRSFACTVMAGWSWIAACPFLAIGRDRPPSEGAISAARTGPRPPHAPAPPGRSSAAGNRSGSRGLPRRWPEASRDRGRARRAPDCRCSL